MTTVLDLVGVLVAASVVVSAATFLLVAARAFLFELRRQPEPITERRARLHLAPHTGQVDASPALPPVVNINSARAVATAGRTTHQETP